MSMENNVTAAIRADLEWLITSEVYCTGDVDPLLMGDLDRLLYAHNWSQEMQAAIRHLADLRAGRIACVRRGESDV